ncbi:MAG: RNHCP domain-containing protein [Deltaproteobacteria bacterium]|nr:RNHCP domain-containing protein [Deltaproteobacteria bacterium]
MLPSKKFSVLNEGFVCGHCENEVSPTSITTPRNHCPFCLWSKHVDINPGDRANPCCGLLRPVGVLTEPRRTYVIVHECQRCHKQTRSKAILKGNQPDDFNLIVKLSQQPV